MSGSKILKAHLVGSADFIGSSAKSVGVVHPRWPVFGDLGMIEYAAWRPTSSDTYELSEPHVLDHSTQQVNHLKV